MGEDIQIEISPGAIDIEWAIAHRKEDGLLIIELGTVQKYPQVVCYSCSSFYLGAGENTTQVDASKREELTRIRAVGLVDDGVWSVQAETGRYGATAVFFRHLEEPEMLWEKEEEC